MIRVAVTAAVVLAAIASTAGAAPSVASCTGSQLAGTFSVVRGSAGAGNITYRLALRNVSDRECVVTGLPQGRLLGKSGAPLPTQVKAAFPGALTAILVRLAPRQRTFADARFSPDVPGPGEPAAGAKCEPTAWWFRVTGQGGGAVRTAVAPPTPVCEHGRLFFSAYSTKPG